MINSLQSIITVCGAVIFFSCISSIVADFLPIHQDIKNVFLGLLEFVTGTNAISQASIPLFEKLILSAGIVGFAGLSVHLQVMSVVSKHGLSLVPYIFGKLIHGVLSMAVMFLILRFSQTGIAVFAQDSLEMSGSFAMNSLFVIMTVVSISFIAVSYTHLSQSLTFYI